jgi:myosin heavy subunit
MISSKNVTDKEKAKIFTENILEKLNIVHVLYIIGLNKVLLRAGVFSKIEQQP